MSKLWRFRQILVASSENFNFKIGKDQTNQMTVFENLIFISGFFESVLSILSTVSGRQPTALLFRLSDHFPKILINVTTFSYLKSALNHSKSTCVTQATDILKLVLTNHICATVFIVF